VGAQANIGVTLVLWGAAAGRERCDAVVLVHVSIFNE